MPAIVSRWGEHGERPEPAAVNDAVFGAFEAIASVEVSCPSQAAWDLLTDVGRIGEFSPECIGARWIDGTSGPRVGARFEGTNRTLIPAADGDDVDFTWIRVCVVTAADAPYRFGYTVGDRYDGTPASTWDFRIEPTDRGCRITQRFRHLPRGISGPRLAADDAPADAEAIVAHRRQQLTNDMAETLRRIKVVLESPPPDDRADRG